MDIKDFLHLYLGCKYRWKNEDGEWSKWLVLNTYQLKWLNNIGGVDVQLRLRKLQDIQKDEVADLLGVEGFITKGNFSAPFFQIEYKDLNNEENFKHAYLTQLSPQQVVFLLSKHFDLFNLIENGLAIDAATLIPTTTK